MGHILRVNYGPRKGNLRGRAEFIARARPRVELKTEDPRVQRPGTVETYIASAPPAQRDELTKLRALIRKHLPRARESLGSSGFPVYADEEGKWLAGFAWRKKHPMLYVMNAAVLDRYEGRLAGLRSGKSCIDWRETNGMDWQTLMKLVATMLAESVRRR
jgi:uncharacterized protein YdhG (YjbR/CyaY superfamily)